MSSWYCATCIQSDHLKPWWLAFISCTVQSILNTIFFYFSGDLDAKLEHDDHKKEQIIQVSFNTKQDSTKTSYCECCGKYLSLFSKHMRQTLCFKLFKMSYAIWQIISILMLIVLDVLKFIEFYRDSNYSGWGNYKCFAAILINSSLSMTVIANLGAISENAYANQVLYDIIYDDPEERELHKNRVDIGGSKRNNYMDLLCLYFFWNYACFYVSRFDIPWWLDCLL
eukprot:439163_1